MAPTDAKSRSRLKRWLVTAVLSLIAGSGLTLLAAWVISSTIPVTQQTKSLQAIDGDEANISVTVDEAFGVQSVKIVQDVGLAWAPMRATGPPDTSSFGDNGTAWASLTQDGQSEWLELDYATHVVPRALQVYENLAPFAIVRATVFDERGEQIEAWKGFDPSKPRAQGGPLVGTIPLNYDRPVSRVRIYLDSVNVKGWNEIDAVGLIGADQSVQWAQFARASSTYASINRGGPQLDVSRVPAELPSWVPFNPHESRSRSGVRTVEAFGWPMVAISKDSQEPAPMRSRQYARASASSSIARNLPRPVWAGFLFDSAIYGAALYALFLSTAGIRRMFKENTRLRRGYCISCGYDVRYNFAGGCPECGWNREIAAQ